MSGRPPILYVICYPLALLHCEEKRRTLNIERPTPNAESASLNSALGVGRRAFWSVAL